jgi:hypothetical protein
LPRKDFYFRQASVLVQPPSMPAMRLQKSHSRFFFSLFFDVLKNRVKFFSEYFLISSRSLDFINLISYDFHGDWESFLGFNAPLYANDQLNVDFAVKYWLAKGASAHKINLGLANFGRSFTLSNPAATTPNSGASGPGQDGRVSNKNERICRPFLSINLFVFS